MEVENPTTEVAVKFDEVNLKKAERGDSSENVVQVDEKLKRNSLSKFFRFKSSLGSEEVAANASQDTIKKTSQFARIFQKKDKDEAVTTDVDLEVKQVAAKTSTMTRLFSKKGKLKDGSEAPASSRSYSMRGLVIPWISKKTSHMNIHQPSQLSLHKPSQMNLQEPLEDPLFDNDDVVQEIVDIVKSEETF